MAMIDFVSLRNSSGMQVTLSNWGARVTSILFPAKQGLQEMLMTYENPADFARDRFYVGATCGRVCNRIADGAFELNGQNYSLSRNSDGNCLHGGIDGFAHKYWLIDRQSMNDRYVSMKLQSRNGDQGFPGTLEVIVSYELSENNQLTITYEATTDRATPVNLTNHAYFNLGESDCRNLKLEIDAGYYLNVDETGIPTGELLSVDGGMFDFRNARNIASLDPSTGCKMEECFDHCFVLESNANPSARLRSEQSGITLKLFTDQSSLQLYTGHFLCDEFNAFQGICLEAQNYVDAINHQHFPDSVIKPDQTYSRFITYDFQQTHR